VLLGTAVIGKAEAVVSGDKAHVVDLGETDGIPILTACEALEFLGMADE